MLNGIYGMTATSLIRDQFKIDENLILKEHKLTDDEKTSTLNKYYSNYNNFMPYQAAIWTTAHSRDALFTMIEYTGSGPGTEKDLTEVYENFLYCDTDSVFYLKNDYNEVTMNKYREECKHRAIKNNAYYGDNFLGMPTKEPKLQAFRALHSKCYAMEEMDDNGQYELQVVIAGIPKQSTKWIDGLPVTKTSAEELGSIDNLNDGFIFKHCGGVRCVYSERPPEIRNINGHITELSSSAIIDNIEKTISETMYTVSKDYKLLHIVQNT